MNMSPEELAEVGYLAYAESTGWKNYRGDSMPKWADLPPAIRAAWAAAGVAIDQSAVAHEEDGPGHVDDFVWHRYSEHCYARFALMLMRLPAAVALDWRPWIERHRLYCTWRGERWRVTGASRFGDVWLARDRAKDHGYDERVPVDECSGWSDVFEEEKGSPR